MMSKAYTAANGQVITDEMIDTWCESYEHGEFPDGEHTVGGIVHGQTHLASFLQPPPVDESPPSSLGES